MSTPTELITQFYTAFAAGDGKTMAACYHKEATFEDPGFGELHGEDIGHMWNMLLQRSKGNLKLEFSNVQADGEAVTAHWEARYPFSATGRKVHNIIEARFEFKDGLIIDHRDRFSLWRWSRQALGIPGLLLGGTSFMQGKIRQKALAGLQHYKQKLEAAASE